MFDHSKIGQSFPPFTFEIERGKIKELAIALGDDNPIYQSREAAQAAGYPDVPASPTTPTMFQFWGNTGFGKELVNIGVNVMRALHGEEEYEYLAPIYAGDVLTGVSTLAEGRTRESKDGSSMDILTVVTSYTNQANTPVLKVREVIVIR